MPGCGTEQGIQFDSHNEQPIQFVEWKRIEVGIRMEIEWEEG